MLVTVCVTGVVRAAEPEWQTVVTGPVTIKNREIPGSPIKEVWAEGDLNAPVQDLQVALLTVERFRYFMPYLKDSRQLGEWEPDGSRYVYTQIDLPVVGKRDYVVHVWVPQSTKPDGSGTFENKWSAVPDRIPRRRDVTRIEKNDGGWVVTPIGDGSKSHVVYKFSVDPGGWVPAFAANMGNEKGVAETFKVVEKEAQRLTALRLAEAAKNAAPNAEASKGPTSPGMKSP